MASKSSILKELYNQGLAAYKICDPKNSVNDNIQKQFSETGASKHQIVDIAFIHIFILLHNDRGEV